MNATDLMLGDYVQIEDEEGKLFIDCICDLGYVPQWNELGVRTCKCGEEWLRECDVMPIPLTKEIIEKNLPFNDAETEKYAINSRDILFYTLDVSKATKNPYIKTWNFLWNNEHKYLFIEDDPLIKCYYVHELQHVLKLCRINKEIVL